MRIMLVLALVTLASCVADKEQGVALDPKYGPFILEACSRWSPEGQRFFRPSEAEISALEESIDEIARLTSTKCCNISLRVHKPENYFRQYVGYENGSKRYVYVSAIHPDNRHSKDPLGVVKQCDGGVSAWRVSYDIAESKFVDLAINAR